MIKPFLLLSILIVSINSYAASEADYIFSHEVEGDAEKVYKSVYDSLEESRFYVIFEANIGKNLARNAKRWGDDYNKNKFEMVKSMVVCNPYFANQVLNLDPEMMALCPITITVLHKQNINTILFERLTPVASGSAAEDVLWEVENTIITAIENAVVH